MQRDGYDALGILYTVGRGGRSVVGGNTVCRGNGVVGGNGGCIGGGSSVLGGSVDDGYGHLLCQHQCVEECRCLSIAQPQVFVAVLVGKQQVVSLSQVVQFEVALLVAAGHIHRVLFRHHRVATRQQPHCRITFGKVCHHCYGLLPGLVGKSVQHLAAHGHAVDMCAGREDILETLQRVALVEVDDAFLELKQIGGVLAQGVLDFH